MPVLLRSSEGFSTITLVKEEQPWKAPQPILVTLLGNVMLVKEEQPMKAYSPMLVTLWGIVMLVKDLHKPKALSPMLVTLSGIVTFVNPPGTARSVFPSFVNKRSEVDLKEGLPESTEKDVRLVQPPNASSSMFVTLFGMVTLGKDSQPQKASSPMLVTLSGIVTFFNPLETATSVFPSFVNKRPEIDLKEGLPESTEKDVRLEQPAKLPPSNLVTLFGIVTLVKDSQPLKAYLSILVTLSGIVMLVKEEQSSKAPQPILVTGFPPSSEGMVNAPDGFGKTPLIAAPSPLTI